MSRIAIVSVVLMSLMVIPAGGASALSCAEPVGFDLAGELDAAEAGAVAEITRVGAVGQEAQIVSLTVTEVFKGELGNTVTLERPHWEPWGPFYQEGHEVALLVFAGEVRDGNENLCGPWYSADELRSAATGLGLEPSPPPQSTGFWHSWLQAMLAAFRSLLF